MRGRAARARAAGPSGRLRSARRQRRRRRARRPRAGRGRRARAAADHGVGAGSWPSKIRTEPRLGRAQNEVEPRSRDHVESPDPRPPGRPQLRSAAMLRRETGQILPGLIVLMLAILALGMLTFRIGRAAVLRSDAQTAADAAALAGARSVRDQLTAQVMSTGTSDLARVSKAAARAAADDYAKRNGARLTDFKMDGADVRAFVDTGGQEVDPPKDDRRGKARARAWVGLVFGAASGGGGGNMGPPPGRGDPTISPAEWKSIAKQLHSPPGCADVV